MEMVALVSRTVTLNTTSTLNAKFQELTSNVRQQHNVEYLMTPKIHKAITVRAKHWKHPRREHRRSQDDAAPTPRA